MAAESSENNGWVESYLEALLSYGLSTEYTKKPQAKSDKVDAERQIHSKYYVSQILQLGEEGIQDAWSKATSSRHYGENDARLEYLSWRVWFMKRNRARVQQEEGRRLQAALNLPDERELDLTVDDEEDMTPKSSEDDKAAAAAESFGFGKVDKELEEVKAMNDKQVARKPAERQEGLSASEQFLASGYQAAKPPMGKVRDPFENRVDGLYVVLISLHGLVRGDRMELGKDPDTGGQVKYVVELARALAQHPAVYRVDLLTRLIEDPKVDKSYSVPQECLLQSDGGELGGAYIVRLACGPRDAYLRKEKLWPHLREFADRGIAHAKRTLVQLTEANTPCELYAVHGHYADAGEVAAMMASTLGTDMIMTGHSLGRNKLEHLLASGTISKTEIEKTYKISRRIEAEERGLDSAMMVFTSTQQEIDEQWGLYDGFDKKLEAVLRSRRRLGRFMPFMNVIPPGLDFSNLKVNLPADPAIEEMQHMKHAFNANTMPVDGASPTMRQEDGKKTSFSKGRPRASESDDGRQPDSPSRSRTSRGSQDTSSHAPVGHHHSVADPPIWQTIFRFLRNPRKPVILAMSRPDAKKNIHTLVQAFGENSTLRELANLVLIMGNRDTIEGMAGGSAKVLQQVLKLIDTFDLYGSVAYPKKHQQSDISDIYRLPYATHGLFTNVALQEPFGLTVIEAAAHGVPTVATKNGGPVDIMSTLHHGLLVDPTKSADIAEACLKILTDPVQWDKMSRAGVDNIMAYSWPSHCKKVLESLEAEKRHLQRAKAGKERLSGSWDHRTPLPAPSQALAPKSDSKVPPRISDRLFSTPHPMQSFKSKAKSAKGPREGPRPSHDDLELETHHSPRATGTPKGVNGRKHFVAVQLDGEYRMQAVTPLLHAVIKAVADRPDIGIGLISMLGFEDTARLLREAGFNSEPLDWIICNSGADIWHALNKEDTTEATWDADEHWEDHIAYRWERTPIAKMVTKLLSGTEPSMLTAPSTMGQTLLKALGNLPEQQEKGVHPHHIRIELDDDAKREIEIGRKIRGGHKEDISTVVVERIRRKLRQNGFRCHITLQMVPAGRQLHSHMHLTPLRSSRALALRYLTNKFNLAGGMQSISVVAVPPNVTEEGDTSRIHTHTSDLIELISGVCKAFMMIPDTDQALPPQQGTADRAVLDRLAIRVTPKIFSNRIQFMRDVAELTSAVVTNADSPVEEPGL